MEGVQHIHLPSDPTLDLRDALATLLPQYHGDYSVGEMADVLTELGDTLDKHGEVPARSTRNRAWTQLAAMNRGALREDAEPQEVREVLYALVLDRDGWQGLGDSGSVTLCSSV